MNLGEAQLAQIGRYVRAELPAWLDELGPWRVGGPLYERAVRVGEDLSAQLGELREQRVELKTQRVELKAQRELMVAHLDAINTRFDDVNARFEASDRRHSATQWLIGVGFTALTTLMTLYRFLA